MGALECAWVDISDSGCCKLPGIELHSLHMPNWACVYGTHCMCVLSPGAE
jgi:hypothetical protein